MIRKLLTNTCHQSRISARRASHKSGEVTLLAYHEASDNKLEELSEKLEATLEDKFDQGADVSLSNGVLTVVVDNHNTYVINKQTPNKQIWLSSPLSGPKRFDLIGERWIDKVDQTELNDLLSKELSELLKGQYKF